MHGRRRGFTLIELMVVVSILVGLMLPRRANEQAAATQKIERQDLQPGDLVFFNTMKKTFSHVGIYVGDNKFIHSPKPGAQVRVEDMGVAYWKSRFDGARRVLMGQSQQQPQPQPQMLPQVQPQLQPLSAQ